jgi:addiction module HigA family antidote
MLLEEFIKPLGITQSALAVRLGMSFPRLNEVTRAKRSVTPDTALRLARVVGMSADFWLGLQQDWDLWHAMRGENAELIAALEPLPAAATWRLKPTREKATGVHVGPEALIVREGARRLAVLGGNEPELRPSRRRRGAPARK